MYWVREEVECDNDQLWTGTGKISTSCIQWIMCNCAIVDTAQWQLCNWAQWLLKKCIFFPHFTMIAPGEHWEAACRSLCCINIEISSKTYIWVYLLSLLLYVCTCVGLMMYNNDFYLLSKYSMCAGLMSGWGCRDGSPGGGDESIHSANHSPAYMCVQPLSNVYIGYIVRYGMVW